jgi:hypothetical protein
MVKGETQVAHGLDGDAIRPFHRHHYRALLDGSHTQNAGLRLVDDRRGKKAAGHSMVGEGKCAALHLVRLELLGTGTFGQVRDSTLQAAQTQLVRILDYGYDQSRL